MKPITRPLPPAAQPRSAVNRLSPLQRRIVECAMRGVGDKLIADAVRASHAAVREHWKRILLKLRVHTRTEAAMLVAMDSPRCSPVPQMRDTQTRNITGTKRRALIKP